MPKIVHSVIARYHSTLEAVRKHYRRMRATGGILLAIVLFIQINWTSCSHGTGPVDIGRRRYGAASQAVNSRRPRHLHAGMQRTGKLHLAGIDDHSALLKLRGGFGFPAIGSGLSFSLHQSKILLQVALTMFNILCWAVPLRSTCFTQNSAVLSYANTFAGGIFLMLSFEHLLPEAVRSMAAGVSGEGTHVIVYALIGYMAMLLIEKVAFVTHITPEEDALVNAGYTGGNSKEQSQISHQNHASRRNSAIALCCAMSVHSFFEAAALGLATDFTAACMMSACIALHQPAESVALLVAFLKSGMSQRSTVLWLTAFSLVSLGGVQAGLLVTSLASATMESVVMAITAGTFIYVGATEIANEEFEGELSAPQRLLRYLCYAAGMGAMYYIAAISRHYQA